MFQRNGPRAGAEEAERLDLEKHARLEAGLIDPVSAIQPALAYYVTLLLLAFTSEALIRGGRRPWINPGTAVVRVFATLFQVLNGRKLIIARYLTCTKWGDRFETTACMPNGVTKMSEKDW